MWITDRKNFLEHLILSDTEAEQVEWCSLQAEANDTLASNVDTDAESDTDTDTTFDMVDLTDEQFGVADRILRRRMSLNEAVTIIEVMPPQTQLRVSYTMGYHRCSLMLALFLVNRNEDPPIILNP